MVRNFTERLMSFLSDRGTQSLPVDEVELDNCLDCGSSLRDNELYEIYRVCPYCRFHHNLTARESISSIVDKGSFKEFNKSIISTGPLAFSSRAPQRKKLAKEQKVTGLTEAVVTGRCTVGGTAAVMLSLDFRFVFGSLGGVVGEKTALAFEAAALRNLPVIASITSGRPVVEENIISTMQMAKVTFAINSLDRKGLPFIAILRNPTTGHIYSSLARPADIILAEPGALLGLAPPTNISGPEKLISANKYRSEAYMARGMVDRIEDRENIKNVLSRFLRISLGPLSSKSDKNLDKDKNISYPSSNQGTHLGLHKETLEELWPQTWHSVRISKDSQRPTSLDHAKRIFTEFIELHGDRVYGDDPSIIAGIGFLGNHAVGIIGHEKGHELTAWQRREGRTMPEGYRKAQRIMSLSGKLKLPLVTLIDTPGPYYGRESEERGLGDSIASTMSMMAQYPAPTIAAVIGEGGSEGALALGIADRILMLENAQYSITMPEYAADSLYSDLPQKEDSASPLILSSRECRELGIVDVIIREPENGANRHPDEAAVYLKGGLQHELKILLSRNSNRIPRNRYKKYRQMGGYSSYFKIAIAAEAAQLQTYVTRSVRLIKRRRRTSKMENSTKKKG
jgi:acetyl-CoA carboxylase carboxyl transferase subunit beta